MPNTQKPASIFSVEKRIIEPSMREGELLYPSMFEPDSSFEYDRYNISNISAPVLSGDFKIPAELTVSEGVYDGSPMPYGYLYSWWRDGVQISGEILNTYTTVPADDGTAITARVTALGTLNNIVTPSNAINTVLYQPIEVMEADIYAIVGMAIPNSVNVIEWTPYFITGLPVESALMVVSGDVYVITTP